MDAEREREPAAANRAAAKAETSCTRNSRSPQTTEVDLQVYEMTPDTVECVSTAARSARQPTPRPRPRGGAGGNAGIFVNGNGYGVSTGFVFYSDKLIEKTV